MENSRLRKRTHLGDLQEKKESEVNLEFHWVCGVAYLGNDDALVERGADLGTKTDSIK